ncbi:prepilin-type N-terminal cleavage/methylation domain-containing protein, partial [Oleiphilus sp. HI0086]
MKRQAGFTLIELVMVI